MVSRFRQPFDPIFGADMKPLAGGTVTFYDTLTGTDTLAAIYEDFDLGVPKMNPVTLDSGGKHGDIFLADADAVRVVVRDALGATVPWGDADPVGTGTNLSDLFAAAYTACKVADVRALTLGTSIPACQILLLSGYYAPGDGGGGALYYDSGDASTADNGGTVFVDVAGRRWKRVVPPTGTNPQMWGGTLDQTAAVQGAAIQACLDWHRYGRVDFGSKADFLCDRPLTAQVYAFDGRESSITFSIAGHTDNCLSFVPVVAGAAQQIQSRYECLNLLVLCNNTGLNGIYCEDGSPRFVNVHVRDSYRDAYSVQPHTSRTQFVENFSVDESCSIVNAGRHALHVWLHNDSGTSFTFVFFNESLFAAEIRGLGRHFADANAIHFTFDGTVNDGGTKIGVMHCRGNWDCDHAGAVAPIGDVIYAEMAGGATGWNVEFLSIDCGGIESTSASTIDHFRWLLNASDGTFSQGSFNHCEIRSVNYYNWVHDVPAVFADVAYGNRLFSPSEGVYKAQNLLMLAPNTDGISLRPLLNFNDATPPENYISNRFKNGPCVYQEDKLLVASGTVTVDIPIKDVRRGNTVDVLQWPICVVIDHSSFPDDGASDFGQHGQYLVRPGWKKFGGTPGPHAIKQILHAIPGSTPASGFDPTNGVSFTVETSDGGTTYDILRVHITGGALVGNSSGSKTAMIAASRFGMGVICDLNRPDDQPNVPGVNINQRL
jgi:hypothetical protein